MNTTEINLAIKKLQELWTGFAARDVHREELKKKAPYIEYEEFVRASRAIFEHINSGVCQDIISCFYKENGITPQPPLDEIFSECKWKTDEESSRARSDFFRRRAEIKQRESDEENSDS